MTFTVLGKSFLSPLSLPEREPLQLPCDPLLLPRLSPLVRMEIPEKLLALVTGGRRVRLELSESVLLQGRGSRHFMSLSVLLWRLLDARLELSRFPLRDGKNMEKITQHVEQKKWEKGKKWEQTFKEKNVRYLQIAKKKNRQQEEITQKCIRVDKECI